MSQWADVAKKRYEELVSGQVTSVSWESIKAKVIGDYSFVENKSTKEP